MSSDPQRKSGEPRSGSNFIWYLLAAGLILVTGFYLVWNQRIHQLSWTDFNQLVGEMATDPQASVKVLATSSTPTSYEYRSIQEVTVGERLVRGKIQATEIGNDLQPVGDPRLVPFQTKKDPSDTVTAELEKRLSQAEIRFSFDGGPDFWEKYGFLLVMTGILLLGVMFVLRRIGRSRGRLYAQEDLGVTFNDVAGIDEAVAEVKEIVDFLSSPEKYQRLGGRIPKGVLLVGPPGTGKTLLAKAIAGEAGVPFFSLSGSDFVEMFVGVGAARVRDMFQQAVSKSPCIIFIDELDALGKTRGGSAIGGHDEREQTLNALLVEMDGFDSNSGVIVMAATNRPETLDQALLRPGRFDRNVLVDRPDVRGREAILKVHVKSVKLDPSVDLKNVSSITPGFVGADLANLVNEAALLAARNEKDAVGITEFNEGVERVTAGLEKKQRVMTEEVEHRIAYHEAGHALVAYSLPNTDPVHKVSIIPRGVAALGYTMQRPESDRYLMTQSELESQLQILLAGTLAEEMIYQDISTGAQNDLERATDLSRAMVTEYGMSKLGRINFQGSRRSAFLSNAVTEDPGRQHSETTAREIDMEIKGIIDRALKGAKHILETRRASLMAITRRLMEVESIDADELASIMNETTSGPTVVPGTSMAKTNTEESSGDLQRPASEHASNSGNG